MFKIQIVKSIIIEKVLYEKNFINCLKSEWYGVIIGHKNVKTKTTTN